MGGEGTLVDLDKERVTIHTKQGEALELQMVTFHFVAIDY